MTATAESSSVQRTITVEASQEHAFDVFTQGIDSWWPRTHHIGKSPLLKSVIEGWAGGRCYGAQEDGTDCVWGQVLVWEPPSRLVIAWQITHQWGYEPDLAKSSEVEVRFTALGERLTRVDLTHGYFERMGAGADSMRTTVSSPGGWGTLLEMFAAKAGPAIAG